MGSCSSGAKGGASGYLKQAESIKQEMLQQGLNSKISSVRKKAEQGIGNYTFKNASAVSAETLDKVTSDMVFHERNGNTLVEGYLEDGRHVFYANKSDSREIQRLQSPFAKEKAKAAASVAETARTGKTTETTTYQRMLKRLKGNFDAYYFGGMG